MCSNYFGNLKTKAQQLDDGIEKLAMTWKLPHVFVGRFAESTAETNSHIEAVWNIIRNTQNGIEETLSEIQNSVPIEQSLREIKQGYKTLKEQCDSLDSVLAEYNYHNNQNDTLDRTCSNTTRSSNRSSAEEPENLQVEFTSNVGSKCKVKQNELTSAINNSTSVSEDSSITYKDYMCIPGRERPPEPIYSKHFYDIFKK